MDAQAIATVVALTVPVLLMGGVWLIRLEGRLNTHQHGCDERQKRLDERHAEIEKKLDHITAKLDTLLETR